ncbi:DegV family protein with EDD domain [Bacillus tianshenii]|uniref:DegV family protein with EDD domain n=1 Tax=Sutcliffiella tianshenii TaxID=1463404 RepID=A0ABS2NX54_9BACI|nr:DegV family protein [Bacillus tianshenii]MBM7618830.1 DegV family protein with EDD domain [Bacillus tianshenii]
MIKIMADSTCDLSNEVLELYDISLASLTINIEGKVYKDRVDLEPDEYYGMLEALSEHPTTGMPSPMEYLGIINEAIEAGYREILCICMSSGTSGAYQSGVLAKDYFYEENPGSPIKIHVVDSKCMSHGSGWLIMKSALMRERGASFEEIVEFIEKYKVNVKHFLSVDDLNHLIKSGRITNTTAFLGKILNLKPIMSMKQGKGAIVGKERGQKRVLRHYVQEFMNRYDRDITEFVIIGYTSDISIAEELKAKMEQDTDFTGDIHIMQMGVSVGTHVGLGAISMFFVEKR